MPHSFKAPLTALTVLMAASALAACTTVEPEPCTAEWVDYRKDKILRSFAIENRSLIRDLQKLANADGDISPMAAISLLQNTKKIERFAASFTDDVIPQLETAFDQCSASEELVPALTEFLRDEGVGDDALQMVGPVLAAVVESRRQQRASDAPDS